MKRLILILIVGFVFIISCNQTEDVELYNNKSYTYQGTTFSFYKDKISVSKKINFKDENINGIILDKNIEMKDGKLYSIKGEKIWFVPFETNKKPIEIKNMNPDVTISCDSGSCDFVTGATCDVEENVDGNGNTVFTCTHDCCKMSVTVSGGNQKIVSNGIILTGKQIIFNK